MKTDVARSSRPKARGKKHRLARLLSRLDFDLVHDNDWLEANYSPASEIALWDHYENLLARVLRRAQTECWVSLADSWVLLELFRDGRPAKGGRPSALPREQLIARMMAAHSHLLELSGGTEAAVADIIKLYGVRRSTVFAARRRAKISQETLNKWRLDPERYLAVCRGALEVKDVLEKSK